MSNYVLAENNVKENGNYYAIRGYMLELCKL